MCGACLPWSQRGGCGAHFRHVAMLLWLRTLHAACFVVHSGCNATSRIFWLDTLSKAALTKESA